MSDDLVVLWTDREAAHRLCYEIVQLAEGEFELRVLRDDHLWMSDESGDVDTLIARARELRAYVHKHGA